MTNCIRKKFEFPGLKNRKIIGSFTGGSVTSDAGVLLLREVEAQLKLLENVSRCFRDNRDQSKVKHSILEMIKQRVFGLALGYEDLNDHDTLRKDTAFQTAVNKLTNLASSPTLCRLENGANKHVAFEIHRVIVEQFITSFDEAPKELILDFDATDDLIYGNQEGKFFHGYYKNYCFLPLYVFCGQQLLVSYLRPSSKDGAHRVCGILALLVKRLRQAWPEVNIVFRGDCGFNRHKMFDWCEKKGVDYIVGQGGNKRLLKMLKPTLDKAEQELEKTAEKQRLFTEFHYQAATWSKERRIIGKAEYTSKGANPRFIVTTLNGDPQELYEKVYCARGDMENRIKEQQRGLFADRTSSHDWWANQFRLLLSSLAYILIEHLRSRALKGTQFERAQASTIRLKLFKIGAVIIRNTRRIQFLFSSYYPYQEVFQQIVARLAPKNLAFT